MTSKHLTEPVAIVGSACRFPGGANSPAALWKLLESPRDVCVDIPTDRFDTTTFYRKQHRDPISPLFWKVSGTCRIVS